MSEPEADVIGRRKFLARISLALAGAAGAVLTVPMVAYLLSPLINPAARVWREVGRLDQFPVGQTVRVEIDDPSPLAWAGQIAKTAAWLRRESSTQFTAFAVNCAHLGCPVDWRPEARLFLCPCHGGVYYADGSVAAGPPPRPLFRYDVRIEGSVVQILTSPLPVV